MNGFDVGSGSAPAIGDIDGDGDPDVFSGDALGRFAFFENTGSATNAGFVERTGSLNPLDSLPVLADSAPALVDLDGDGDLDAISGGAFISLFENQGTATQPMFVRIGGDDPFHGLAVASDAAPSFVDIDDDGDADVFVGSGDGTFAFFENAGSPLVPSYTPRMGGQNPLAAFSVAAAANVAFADIDDDGDFDAFTGSSLGDYLFLENTGTAASPAFILRLGSENPLAGFDIGAFSSPTLGDLDGDGDLDIVSGQVNGEFAYFENFGSASNPMFNPFVFQPLAGHVGPAPSTPTLVDIDEDGDLDLFSGAAFFENIGTPTSPLFEEHVGGVSNPLAGFVIDAGPAFADLDGDGDLEALAGRSDGSLVYLENQTSVLPPVSVPLPWWARLAAGAWVVVAAATGVRSGPRLR